jgi:hypothetical protein
VLFLFACCKQSHEKQNGFKLTQPHFEAIRDGTLRVLVLMRRVVVVDRRIVVDTSAPNA